MDSRQFYKIMEQSDDLSKSNQLDLKIIVEQYPYFQPALFLYLKSLYLYDNENFKTELHRLSVFINDRKSLFHYIMNDEFYQFFKKSGKTQIREDRTNTLLNAFFETQSQSPDGFINLDQDMAVNSLASNDYFSYIQNIESFNLEQNSEQKKEPQLKHHEIIDSFIEKSEKEGVHIVLDQLQEPVMPNILDADPSQDEELDEDLFFTETLARIYVKQKKYEKAYKIIKHLSLNKPQKNIYFADQLHFLEKLIINSKYKDKK